jgi:hypothetical protein
MYILILNVYKLVFDYWIINMSKIFVVVYLQESLLLFIFQSELLDKQSIISFGKSQKSIYFYKS